MSAKLAPLFARGKDDWATPAELYEALDREFRFTLDAAATRENQKAFAYYGPDHEYPEFRDALARQWAGTCWLNPPYSRVKDFIAKAAEQARKGNATVVCLVPARTDTQWFHAHIWDEQWQRARPGVEVRFIKGRVRFGAATSGAPFPSMVVIFHRWA